MSLNQEHLDRLRKRADGIAEWLGDEAPYTSADQLHLNKDTPERAYWHHGYMMALRDVLRLVEADPTASAGSGDTSD